MAIRYAGRRVRAPGKPMAVTLLLVAAAATALLVPFLFFGNASGHDFEFHLASWMDVARQWRAGVWYPRWAELANWGYGEPRFLFYPPASWLLGAALSRVLPWAAVPGVFFWICLVAGGASMYRLAREWLPESAATLAAVVYAANPYFQLQLYWRSDFAEMMASAIFPLVVLCALRAVEGERCAALWLALLFGATWLMNVPAAVVVTYSTALLAVVSAAVRRSWRGLLLGAGGMALGFAIAATYIVPAAYEKAWVNIAEVLSAGLRPGENFLYTWIDDPEHNWFNFMASTVAVSEMLAAALALTGARRLREHREAWWPLVALLGLSAVLMLRISAPAWKFLPELIFVQFPWRWLLAFNLVLPLLLAAVASRGKSAWLWAGSVAALAVCALLLAPHAWWDSDGVNDLRQAILVQGKGYFGTDEYEVRGADHYDLDLKAARVSVTGQGTQVQIERWQSEDKVLTVRSEQPVALALRLMSYPAWKVWINGSPASWKARPNTKEMVIEAPSGTSQVRVRFTRTPDRTVGSAISLAAFAAWLLLLSLERRAAATRLGMRRRMVSP